MGGRRAAQIRFRPLNCHRSQWDLISVRRQKNIETSQREEGVRLEVVGVVVFEGGVGGVTDR